MKLHPMLARAIVFILSIGCYSFYFFYVHIFDWCRDRPGYPHKFKGPESTFLDCVSYQLDERYVHLVLWILMVMMAVVFIVQREKTKTVAMFYGFVYLLFFLYLIIAVLTYH